MNAISERTLRGTAFVMRTLSRLLKLYLLFFLLAFGLAFLKDVSRYPLLPGIIRAQDAVQRPMLDLLRQNIPPEYTRFKGRDITPAILFALFMAVWILLDARIVRLQLKASELRHRDWEARRKKADREMSYQPETLQSASAVSFSPGIGAAYLSPQPSASGAPGTKRGGAAGARKLDREKLLEIYARTRKALDEQKRSIAFLAIDVVDSTGMKRGEDPEAAARDFRQYRRFVQKIIEDHGALKAAWTPDGVMACFPGLLDAVKAAKRVIQGLEHFNRRVKGIQRDFRIRAGINAGTILFDDGVPMEEMSDRTIDIAGHMQKHAEPDSIFISKQAVETLERDQGFVPADRVIDGKEAYIWKSEVEGER